ncbi:MAG: transposase [Bacteroidota bacterium]|nr:transposase [Bacteroidota bacterium]
MTGSKYHDFFEEGHLYHVYNRSINKEVCFQSDRNYEYFLSRFAKYIAPSVDVYAYCLMPTHFHFLLRIKDGATNDFMEKQFKGFLSGYSLAFNKENERNGSLFQKSFKRIQVTTEQYLCLLIHYIHHNPIHHGHTNNFFDWKYSSYNAILSDQPTMISRNEVLELFNGKAGFREFHEEIREYEIIDKFICD